MASDVLETPIILIARTDALHANLITSDFDDVDKPYLTGKRTQDGYFELKNNKELACLDVAHLTTPEISRLGEIHHGDLLSHEIASIILNLAQKKNICQDKGR